MVAGALYSNTNSSNLVAIGDSALYNNGVGVIFSDNATKNTAIGSKALYNNTTGSFNTANGYEALLAIQQAGAGNAANGI